MHTGLWSAQGFVNRTKGSGMYKKHKVEVSDSAVQALCFYNPVCAKGLLTEGCSSMGTEGILAIKIKKNEHLSV